MNDFLKPKILIFDDDEMSYNILYDCLKDNFECEERIFDEVSLRKKLDNSFANKDWYHFILIDFDLSKVYPNGLNGIHLYERMYREYPNETYIIYSKTFIDDFKKDIVRLSKFGVKFMLFDDAMSDESLSLQMIQTIPFAEPNKIFLVHGRNMEKKGMISKLLGKKGFGLDVTDWDDAIERVAGDKRTIWNIVLQGINMSYLTLVLFTDDEDVKLKKALSGRDHRTAIKRAQSRPNVFIEAGYAMGIRPLRTIFLEWADDPSGFQQASDFAGIDVVRYDDSKESREQLKRRLEIARCLLKVNRNWKTMSLS